MTKSGKGSHRAANRVVRQPATKFAHLRKRMQQRILRETPKPAK
jgi:hypothetical protein